MIDENLIFSRIPPTNFIHTNSFPWNVKCYSYANGKITSKRETLLGDNDWSWKDKNKKQKKMFNGLLCKRCSHRMTLQFTFARNRIQNSKFYLRHKITIHMKLSAQSVHRAYMCMPSVIVFSVFDGMKIDSN